MEKNYYGSLCTEVYEILHNETPEDELEFYLSYADKSQKILEALCGSGRFLIPFLDRGYNIKGLDSFKEMIEKLLLKRNDAKIFHENALNITIDEKFDYIFITSGSVSLFTNLEEVKELFSSIKNLLNVDGKFIFAVDTIKIEKLIMMIL